MPTATLTSKGQITLPVEVRRSLGLRQGSRVDFVPDGHGYRLQARSRLARDLAGALPKPDRPVSLEEMDDAIATAAADVVVESGDMVLAALDESDSLGQELPDILIARSASRARCARTVTFDRRASTIPGMEAL